MALFNGRDGEWFARLDGLGKGWASLVVERPLRAQAVEGSYVTVIHDREVSVTMGVNVSLIFTVAFTIGALAAALGGAFIAPTIAKLTIWLLPAGSNSIRLN